jgi:large subunit ribosomal protein L31
MKTAIHPKYYDDAKVTCACGNVFTTGATVPEIKVEVCYNCHPFYTGTVKLLDSAGRVDAFEAKMAGMGKKILTKTEKRRLKQEKRLQEEQDRPESLAQLRNSAN